MPLPESSTPQPDDLNPLTDVLYLEDGQIKKITPKHPSTKPKELFMTAATTIQIMGDSLYGEKEKFLLKVQPTWVDCLLNDVANELNISVETFLALLEAFHNKDYHLNYLNTDGFHIWGIKEGLDELHPFLELGLLQIKTYHESKSATGPLSREDLPHRQRGNG